MNPEQKAPDLIGIGAQAVVENAERLGLTWQMRSATVVSSSSAIAALAVYDGDTIPIGMTSVVGPLAAGTRVMVIQVPPSGNFIIGLVQTGLRLTHLESATADTTTAIGGGGTTLSGTTITVTTTAPSAQWEAAAVFDFDETGAGTTILLGRIVVDSVVSGSPNAILEVTNVNDRATVAVQRAGLFTPGVHTFDLNVIRTVNAGTQNCNSLNTNLIIKIYQ